MIENNILNNLEIELWNSYLEQLKNDEEEYKEIDD